MSDDHSGEPLALERLLFFSDAVFAIAITLLVIEIKAPVLPHGASDGEIGRALLVQTPRFIGFATTFFLIGQTWIEHHRIGRLLTGFDLGLLWKNLFLLFVVAAMPFASALLSEFFGSPLVTTIYALVFAALGLAKAAFWRHAVRRGLVLAGAPDARHISRRVWSTPLTAGVVAVVSALGVPFGVMGFAMIPVVARILDRK